MKRRAHIVDSRQKLRIMDRISEILRSRSDILFAYVYGSFVDELPFHDIDVAVYVAGSNETAATLDAMELSSRISSELNIPVDLRPLNLAPIPFRYQAIRGKLLFEKDEDLTTQFIEQTVLRYLDIKPLLLTGMREAFAA